MKGEKLISIATAAELVEPIDGTPVCRATVYRWGRVGVNGKRLELRRVGKRVATSREALDRFMASLGESGGAA